MIFGKSRENFSIQQDVSLVQLVNEAGVVYPERSQRRVKAHLPQAAEHAFLRATIAEGVRACFQYRDASLADVGLASPHHALCFCQETLASLDVLCTTFDSRHIG